MTPHTWSTSDIPAPARFEAWADTLSATHLEWELVGSRKDFEAQVVARDVGDVRLVGCRCDPCEGFRAPRHIQRAEGEHIGILFELAGSEIVRQGDRETTLRPGDFVIWDSQKPMEFRVLEPLQKMTILVPKPLMRRFLPEVDAIAGMRIDGTENLGPLVAAHLQQLSIGLGSLEEKHLRLVADTTLELVAAGVGAKLDRRTSIGDGLYGRLCEQIAAQLSDPDLTPTAIASANGISLRYLHKLFSSRGQSVSRWILKARLDKCRRALATEGRSRSITDVALSWGFNDGAHFSRSFRNEFGLAPRELVKRSR